MSLANYAKSLIYDGINLFTKYNMIIAEINGNATATNKNISELKITTEKVNRNDYFSIIDNNFDEPLSFHFQLFECNGSEILSDKLEELTRLFVRKSNYYTRMEFVDDINYANVYYMCKCISFSKITIGGICRGIEIQLTTNAPYGFNKTDFYRTFNISNGSKFTINDISDLSDNEISLDTSIYVTSSGSFKMTNNITGKTTIFNNCISGEMIEIDGFTHCTTSTKRSAVSLFNDFNFVFPTVTNTIRNRTNIYTFTGTCEAKVTLKYTPIRTIGA